MIYILIYRYILFLYVQTSLVLLQPDPKAKHSEVSIALDGGVSHQVRFRVFCGCLAGWDHFFLPQEAAVSIITVLTRIQMFCIYYILVFWNDVLYVTYSMYGVLEFLYILLSVVLHRATAHTVLCTENKNLGFLWFVFFGWCDFSCIFFFLLFILFCRTDMLLLSKNFPGGRSLYFLNVFSIIVPLYNPGLTLTLTLDLTLI